jgi:Aspartyl/asparaginyl beta-hydroxylase and related dioxygenases
MQVADEFVHWQEGRTLVFDDTYPHEVWNDTKEQRVVLLVQFRRPVGWLGKLVSEAFLSGIRRTPFVQDARAEIGHWERVMQRLETSGRG